MAQTMGLPSPLHPGSTGWASRDGVPGGARVLPHEGRDGLLPGGVCRTPRPSGAAEHGGRRARAGREPLRPDCWRAANGSGPRGRGDRRLPVAQDPRLAPELDPAIVQVHAGAYRNPTQLRDGPVLVVGAGNSGAEIALETAAAGHPTSLSGRHPGHVPSLVYRGGGRAFWWFASRVLSVDTPIGRRVRRKALVHGGPLIRVKPKDVIAA